MPIELGNGFDSVSKDVKENQALMLKKGRKECTIAESTKYKKDNNFFYYIKQAGNDVRKDRTYNVDGEVTVPLPISVGAKLGINGSHNHSRNEAIFIIHFYKVEKIKYIKSEVERTLKKDKEKILAKNDAQFLGQYGDNYISEIAYGREGTAIIHISNITDKSKLGLDASVKGGQDAIALAKLLGNFKSSSSTQKLDVKVTVSTRGPAIKFGDVKDKKAPSENETDSQSMNLDQLIDFVNEMNKTPDYEGDPEDLAQLHFKTIPYSQHVSDTNMTNRLNNTYVSPARKMWSKVDQALECVNTYINFINELQDTHPNFFMYAPSKRVELDTLNKYKTDLNDMLSKKKNTQRIEILYDDDLKKLNEIIIYLKSLRAILNQAKIEFKVCEFVPRSNPSESKLKISRSLTRNAESATFQPNAELNTLDNAIHFAYKKRSIFNRKELQNQGLRATREDIVKKDLYIKLCTNVNPKLGNNNCDENAGVLTLAYRGWNPPVDMDELKPIEKKGKNKRKARG